MKKKHMGGAATNSGINFQQRVAAMALVAQYTKFDLSSSFGINQAIEIDTVYFETADAIDDLKIKCKDCSVFVQIKRSVSLQINPESDFYNTIDQFLQQYLKGELQLEYYILATSSNSSRVLTEELSKMLEAIRLNDQAFDENPLSKSESETLLKYKEVFNVIYKFKTGKVSTEELFKEFSKRIYITIVDIEAGRPSEQVAIVLLNAHKLVDPPLVWNMLIANCLEYAKKRLSVDKGFISILLDKYTSNGNAGNASSLKFLKEYFNTEFVQKGNFPVAKEVLLIESFLKDADILLVELYRFTDDGQLKFKFRNDKVRHSDTNIEWNVIYRSATLNGMERLLKLDVGKWENKRLTLIPINPDYDIQKEEDSPTANVHKKHLQVLANKNVDFLNCLHCGKILEPGSILVEIEDLYTPSAVGGVHNKCLRSIDRVLGVLEYAQTDSLDPLKNFDFLKWAQLRIKGQALMNSLNALKLNDLPAIGWSNKKGFNHYKDFGYCISFILSDGSSKTITDRGKIERFNKKDANETKDLFFASILKARKDRDPLGYTSKSLSYGTKSKLLEMISQDEDFLEIEAVEIIKYSKLLEKREDLFSYYSPMCFVLHTENESILNLGKIVPLISNPLEFKSLYNSWEKFLLNEPITSYELRIIQSDDEFDAYMREFFADGMQPFINPRFNNDIEVIGGFPIEDIQSKYPDKPRSQNRVLNPKWLKNDKVQLILPSIKDEVYPEGIVLEDEFENEEGELSVFIRPVENEKELDLVYEIPSSLLKKIDFFRS